MARIAALAWLARIKRVSRKLKLKAYSFWTTPLVLNAMYPEQMWHYPLFPIESTLLIYVKK